MSLWQRCTGSLCPPIYLNGSDFNNTFYLYEYVSGGNYQMQGNSIIYNFKMTRKAQPNRLQYRNDAIGRFAQNIKIILNIIPCHPDAVMLVPMPTSKPRNHSEFDDRLDCVVNLIGGRVGLNLDKITSKPPLHHDSNQPRDIQKIMDNIQFTPFDDPRPEFVVLIDDVVTTGASYCACVKKIGEYYPEYSTRNIFGLFLAKTTWPDG